MKTLFITYSHEGNCRALAAAMAETVNGDTADLRLAGGDAPTGFVKKYLVGGKGALFKETPPLLPLSADPDAYDLVTVGGPVWAFTMAPAVRTFLTGREWHGGRVALFVMHRGGKGSALPAMEKLVAERGGAVAGAADFVDLRRGDAEKTRQRAREWIRGILEK